MTDPSAPTDAVRRAAAILGERARADVPLGPMTTYRVGGPAALFLSVESDADLALLSRAVRESSVPVLVVGNGSNLLVADRGFVGLAVVLGEAFAGVHIDGTRVRAGAGALLPVVARRTAAAGLTGFEWAVGVPGSIGGAVRMNAGGHGSDIAESLVGVRVIDLRTGEDEEMPARALGLSFRHSELAPHQLVVAADLRLRVGDRAEAERTIAEIVRWRRENQPGGANAGSVFVNPEGRSAGELIDRCGAKGLRLGTAHVSEKHANFIQADDGGSADDIYRLMGVVRHRVEQATGIRMRSENRLVGFPSPEPPDPDPETEGESQR